MKVLILYFSATGNTAKMAKVIEERFAEMGSEVTLSNMTSYTNRQEKIDLAPYDAVVFGAPVHARRVPKVVREWLRTLNGQGKNVPCSSHMAGLASTPLIIQHERYWKNNIFA
jgi:menaquinone-dependent protoporphyrinogen IX oxidase